MPHPRPRALIALALAILILALPLASGCSRQLTTEQKLADFRYLFATLRDGHPLLAERARVEGYDWIAHEAEFEARVRATRTDAEFAREIMRMMLLIRDGHTDMMSSRLVEMFKQLPPEMAYWQQVMAEVDPKEADNWRSLALPQPDSAAAQTRQPFQAIYACGEYVVTYAVASGAGSAIRPGLIVDRVDGVPVHDFVAGLRGEILMAPSIPGSQIPLRFDPLRRRVYTPELVIPPGQSGRLLTLRNPADSQLSEAYINYSNYALPGLPYFPVNSNAFQRNIYTAFLADGTVGYLHIAQMSMTASDSERSALREFFGQIGDLPALIIDIRGNGGGNDLFWMREIVSPLLTEPKGFSRAGAAMVSPYFGPFMESKSAYDESIDDITIVSRTVPKSELADLVASGRLQSMSPEILTPAFGDPGCTTMTLRPSRDTGYRGRVFLLVDQNVFSASEGFAQFCKRSGWATLVGSPTGGAGGGQPVPLILPNSRMALRLPSRVDLNPEDWSNNEETHTMPDVVAESSPEDLVKLTDALARGTVFPGPDPQYDTALRKCLELAIGSKR